MKKILAAIGDFFLSIGCRKFYENMPKEDDNKIYTVRAFTTIWGGQRGYSSFEEKKIIGLQRAYRVARRLGKKLDHRISSHGGCVGIGWELIPEKIYHNNEQRTTKQRRYT